MLRIGIVAGEASGDIIASGLIAAIKRRYPDAIFEGIAGPLMIKQGCKALFDSEKLAVMGFTEVLSRLREILKIRKTLAQHFIDNPPDVFIGVDAPDFNLALEEKLHKAGIKTCHYVSPSVWAWRQGRVKKIARSVDLMLTLFPFEQAFYTKHKVPVRFVGHPLADQVPMETDRKQARQQLGLDPAAEYLALLPGSRMSEVSKLAPLMLDAAVRCLKRKPDLKFVAPFASLGTRTHFHTLLQSNYPQLHVELIQGQSREVMSAANVILLASGTAALEAMLVKRPTVVTYKVSRLSYLIYKSMVKVKNVSLPNLLAGEALIPELIQDNATPAKMADAVMKYFDDASQVSTLVGRFTEIHKQLKLNASEAAANAVLELTGSKHAD